VGHGIVVLVHDDVFSALGRDTLFMFVALIKTLVHAVIICVCYEIPHWIKTSSSISAVHERIRKHQDVALVFRTQLTT
jgi:hypothetical protein